MNASVLNTHLNHQADKAETATLETVVTELRELRKAHNAVLDELKGLREAVGAGRLLEHKPSWHDEKTADNPRHSFVSIIDKLKAASD